MNIFSEFDWALAASHLAQLGLAFLLALPTGWDREKARTGPGLRTFPLCSVVSCGFMLTAVDIAGSDANAIARVLQGLITGIGFIGGGAILVSKGRVRGTATATGIWCTGAIGATVALQRYEIATALAVLAFASLSLLGAIKERSEQLDDPD